MTPLSFPDRPWIASASWPEPLVLSRRACAALPGWIAAGYPHETCGLLVGRHAAGATEVVYAAEAANLDTTRAHDRYELDPAAFLGVETAADAEGLEVVGIWHSHPDVDPVPSRTDHERAWDGYAYLIARVGPRGVEAMSCWRRDGDAFKLQAIHEETR